MLEHKDRLREALALAEKTAASLQKELGISPAAMTYLLDGATKSFNAANNAKAARFLDVDAFWLATGEGQPRPQQPWPFPMILPSQWAQLDTDFRRQVENNVVGEWMRAQQKSGTYS